ncbi:MAG: SUMF1/EgtB/PvdO family nonheme iron enzyme [Cyanobacteria bacterium CRU_2_1]|nr:SUMF1/EgtB/PvdO family nonheme iron enzyme [Cyanobacteria bacterium RU_5_0]NJR58309.1 SUMF1/EgtB/PvdO family nonheme iron enzyme [Cyanobacteria bacterium CRU_2_1]
MGNNWAIVIGINHYEHHPEYRLNYAVRDAELMGNFLCDFAGFSRDQVIFCLGDEHHRSDQTYPTRANLLKHLHRNLAPEKLGNVDRLWVFFSGHGINADGRDWLITSDCLAEDTQEFALPTDKIIKILRQHRKAEIVLVLDACRPKQGKSISIGEQTVAVAKKQRVTTISSCDYGQSSYELNFIQQGSFTYALVEGLQIYTLPNQLASYLRRRVPELNRTGGKPDRQTPIIQSEIDREVYQSLLPECVTEEDINAWRELAHQAKRDKNPALSRGLWKQVIERLPDDEEAKLALVELDSENKIPRRPFLKWLALFLALPGVVLLTRLIRSQSETVPSTNPVPSSTPQPDVEFTPVSVSRPEYTQPVGTGTAGGLPLWNVEFQTVTVDELGNVVKRDFSQSQIVKENLGDGIFLEMVKISGGTFEMGSSLEEKGHETDEVTSQGSLRTVRVSPYFIGKFPVTQAQYKAVMGQNPSLQEGDNLPVLNVDWYKAVAFCESLSRKTGRTYRLPSEAEWEYACRAKTTTPFCFGRTLSSGLANYDWTKAYQSEPKKNRLLGMVTEVGTFPPNAFGLYDVHGNVWEWCADSYQGNYDGLPKNGEALVSNQR